MLSMLFNTSKQVSFCKTQQIINFFFREMNTHSRVLEYTQVTFYFIIVYYLQVQFIFLLQTYKIWSTLQVYTQYN